MKISFQQLKYLIKTAETGSMTDAAKALGISQATLSEAISQVESEVGFKIFTRSRRGVAPTKKGIEALGYARRAVNSMENFEQRYGKKPAPKTRFSISTHPLKIAIAAFNETANRAKRGTYDFSIAIEPFQKPIEDLVSGVADLGIMALSDDNEKRMLNLMEENGLEFHKLIDAPLYASVDSSHPLASQRSIAREDLKPYPCFDANQIKLVTEKQPQRTYRVGDGKMPQPDDENLSPMLKKKIAGVSGYRLWCKLFPTHTPEEETVAIPLEPAEFLKIGYVAPTGSELNDISKTYIKSLARFGAAGLEC